MRRHGLVGGGIARDGFSGFLRSHQAQDQNLLDVEDLLPVGQDAKLSATVPTPCLPEAGHHAPPTMMIMN